MERASIAFLFGRTSATAEVEEEAPPEEIVPFKIPMKIIDRVMHNRYEGDGTVHPGDHLLFLHELCELFKCAGISMGEVKKKLFSISLSGRAAHWYKLLKNGCSLGWEQGPPKMPRVPPKMPRSSFVQLFESFPAPPESPLSELASKSCGSRRSD